jgi:hypothetical protein
MPADKGTRWLCLCLSLLGAAGRAGAEDASFGPLFQEFGLTLAPGRRTEALGPLYYAERLEESKLWAVPPVFSYELNEGTDFAHFDFAWKVITYDRFGDEYRWQLLQMFSIAGGGTQSDTNVHRFTLVPVYFQQRSTIPEKNYTAVLPIYGTIKERLFRDEIKFVLFPLYGQSRKRDIVTDNYLYPVFHLRHGNGLKGWQFWPLAGREHKELTRKTNVWGEVEIVGGHDKAFAVWPLYSWQRTGEGTAEVVRQEALLPFYSYYQSPKRVSETFLWPLGVTHTIEREKKYEEWGVPWPLIVFTRGEGKTCNRVWPFFSHAHNATLTSEWFLWPIYKYNRLKSDPFERERTRILLFLYSDTRAANREAGVSSRQIDLWPLFTARRDFQGKSRLQLFSPLEPILPNNRGVERNLSPLWSVWRSEKDRKTGATSQSLLWNLYRRESSPQARKCSLLFGLFQYQSGPDGARWRLLYIPFGKARKPKPAA